MISYQTVSRDALRSPAASPRSSPDPVSTQQLLARIRDQFTFTAPETVEEDGNPEVNPVEEDEEEADLVLFAGPVSAAPQRIRLQSPDAGDGEGGFSVKKPSSYYFADESDSEKEAEFRAAAIDSATILVMAKEPWPACAVPWKVTKISAAGIQKSVLVPHASLLQTVEEKAPKRTRKGKKSRIALRQRLKAREAKKAEEEILKKQKEEAEKAKKIRRNREKKLKKKAKEKAEKAKKLAEAGIVEMDVDGQSEVDSNPEED